MARPEEKAQAMLNKWVKMKEEGDPTSRLSRLAARREKRPFLASHCEHLADAEKFRKQIIGEISAGVKKIQNAGLGEHAIRDLNDGINKLIREKWHWNRRIKELGGRDYNKEERRAQLLAEKEGATTVGAVATDGTEDYSQLGTGLRGSGGYRYFGAAKDLPGVKELFARHAAKTAKRKRGDVYKYITPDYYGFRDEEDGVLLELEGRLREEGERELKSCREEYRRRKQQKSNDGARGARDDGGGESSDESVLFGDVGGVPPEDAVPSREAVRQALLEKKREALLGRFS